MAVRRPAGPAAAFGSAQTASPANTVRPRRRGPALVCQRFTTAAAGPRLARALAPVGPMTHLLADLRLAARSLARAPLFSLVAIVSIALGIGANTAVFTLLDQVALRPLPVRGSGALVQLHARGEENYGGTMGNGTELSWPMFLDFRDKAPGFDGVVGRVPHAAARRPGRRQRAHRRRAGLGQLLRACSACQPALGRLFTAADDVGRSSGHPLAVLGYDYWRRRFAGRADILGQARADQRPAVHRRSASPRAASTASSWAPRPTSSCR